MADDSRSPSRASQAAEVVPDDAFMVAVGPFARQVAEAAYRAGRRFDLWMRGGVHRLNPAAFVTDTPMGRENFSQVLSASRCCEMAPTELAARALRGRVDVHFVVASVHELGQVQASVQTDQRWTGALAVADVLEYVKRPVIVCDDIASGPAWRGCTYDYRDRWRREPAAALTVLTSSGIVTRRAADGFPDSKVSASVVD